MVHQITCGVSGPTNTIAHNVIKIDFFVFEKEEWISFDLLNMD